MKKKKQPPPPPMEMPHDFCIGGWFDTGQFRLRPTWHGVVLEERRNYRDGTSKWKRRWYPINIEEKRR